MKPGKEDERQLPEVLRHLGRHEARELLRRLLEKHPELVEEAEELALALVASVDVGAVAEDLHGCLERLDYGDLAGRAGRQRHGYVDPTDATWEILEEAVEPFHAELRRLIWAGVEEAAASYCGGIVLGLHRAESSDGGELLQNAPDFPAEAAAQAARLLAEESREEHGKSWRLPPEILHEVPGWQRFLTPARALGRSL